MMMEEGSGAKTVHFGWETFGTGSTWTDNVLQPIAVSSLDSSYHISWIYAILAVDASKCCSHSSTCGLFSKVNKCPSENLTVRTNEMLTFEFLRQSSQWMMLYMSHRIVSRTVDHSYSSHSWIWNLRKERWVIHLATMDFQASEKEYSINQLKFCHFSTLPVFSHSLSRTVPRNPPPFLWERTCKCVPFVTLPRDNCLTALHGGP